MRLYEVSIKHRESRKHPLRVDLYVVLAPSNEEAASKAAFEFTRGLDEYVQRVVGMDVVETEDTVYRLGSHRVR